MHKRKFFYLSLLICTIVYITAIFLAPFTPNRFKFTATEIHLLQISIALPIVIIWFIAVFGAERLKSYSQGIIKYPDGRAMNKVATGLALLAASIIINGLIGAFRPWAIEGGWLPIFTICANYIAVLLPLIAFWLIYKGSDDLKKVAKKAKPSMGKSLLVIAAIAALAIAYVAMFLNYDYRSSTPDPTLYRSFYIPDILIILTLVLPYLIGWGLGLKAAVNIAEYQQYVQGHLYRAALKRLTTGIIIVIAFAVIVQLLVSLSTYFARASIGKVLVVLYVLIFIYALGYLTIASGAKKLSKIEASK